MDILRGMEPEFLRAVHTQLPAKKVSLSVTQRRRYEP
jgi:hypothetical protein